MQNTLYSGESKSVHHSRSSSFISESSDISVGHLLQPISSLSSYEGPNTKEKFRHRKIDLIDICSSSELYQNNELPTINELKEDDVQYQKEKRRELFLSSTASDSKKANVFTSSEISKKGSMFSESSEVSFANVANIPVEYRNSSAEENFQNRVLEFFEVGSTSEIYKTNELPTIKETKEDDVSIKVKHLELIASSQSSRHEKFLGSPQKVINNPGYETTESINIIESQSLASTANQESRHKKFLEEPLKNSNPENQALPISNDLSESEETNPFSIPLPKE